LGDTFKLKQGQQVPVEEQYPNKKNGMQRFIRIVDITTVNEPERYIKYDGDNLVTDYDLFMVRYGASAGTVGYNMQGVIANNLFRFIPLIDIDTSYFYQVFNSLHFEIKGLSGNTAMPALNFTGLDSLKFFIPCKTEQTTIGTFFRTLDNTIAIHKRKLDGLRELKKAYLQVMFPQAGETVPRVRFKGFSDGWKVRLLGDISIKVNEKNKDCRHAETFTNSAEYGIISQRDFFDKNISNEKNLGSYSVVHPDDFVYNPRISNFAPVGPIKRNLLGKTGVMSPLYYVFRITEGDLTFMERYFESFYWHEFMKMNGDNGVRADRFNIKDSTFEQMPIPYPNLKEQEAIGNFINRLDFMVADQQSKLNKMIYLKSAYLQKMFV